VLTPYDEFPVHQTPQPFSHIPSTDYSWDEGYWFAIFNPEEKMFVGVGARVNPNTDMFGGYAFINRDGIQRTVRFSRAWRRNFELDIGPLHIRFPEPLKTIQLTLDRNASGIEFDLLWHGTSPAYLEERQIVVHRGRRTTDQTRYSQAGKVSGSLALGDSRWTLDPEKWSGGRDHSWGLYVERAPLAPNAALLPPRQPAGKPRALRIWTCFRTGPVSGFFHLHETADGEQCQMDDPFGFPFGGVLCVEGQGEMIHLATGRHQIEYREGTRIATRAAIYLTDEAGGEWTLELTPVAAPWFPATLGYTPGSWKDGGTFHTFHGSEELASEWDEFDFSRQPVVHKPYRLADPGAHDAFGLGFNFDKPMIGIEYLTRAVLRLPGGDVAVGAAHFEHYINGAYRPYGFT
jgi:hypothetical protein